MTIREPSRIRSHTEHFGSRWAETRVLRMRSVARSRPRDTSKYPRRTSLSRLIGLLSLIGLFRRDSIRGNARLIVEASMSGRPARRSCPGAVHPRPRLAAERIGHEAPRRLLRAPRVAAHDSAPPRRTARGGAATSEGRSGDADAPRRRSATRDPAMKVVTPLPAPGTRKRGAAPWSVTRSEQPRRRAAPPPPARHRPRATAPRPARPRSAPASWRGASPARA